MEPGRCITSSTFSVRLCTLIETALLPNVLWRAISALLNLCQQLPPANDKAHDALADALWQFHYLSALLKV